MLSLILMQSPLKASPQQRAKYLIENHHLGKSRRVYLIKRDTFKDILTYIAAHNVARGLSDDKKIELFDGLRLIYYSDKYYSELGVSITNYVFRITVRRAIVGLQLTVDLFEINMGTLRHSGLIQHVLPTVFLGKTLEEVCEENELKLI